MRKLHDKELGQFMFQMPPTETLRKDTDIAKPFMLATIRPHSRKEVMIIIFGKENHYFAHKISEGLPKIDKVRFVSPELLHDCFVFNACASMLACNAQMYERLQNNMQIIRRYIAMKDSQRLSEMEISNSKSMFTGRKLAKISALENTNLKIEKQAVSHNKAKCIEYFGQKIEMEATGSGFSIKADADNLTNSLISASSKSEFRSIDSVISYLSNCSPYARDYSGFLQLI